MKIGVTERGDAALDLSWMSKRHTVDGLILITKDCGRAEFITALQELTLEQKPFILHATCTGMGGTRLEPGVPSPHEQIGCIKRLIERNIVPAERVVIRIDPILPTDTRFLTRVLDNIYMNFSSETLAKMRFRVSVMDFYKHVKERMEKYHCGDYVTEGFTATKGQFNEIAGILSCYPLIQFEACAENELHGLNIVHTGCVSKRDIEIMELNLDDIDNSTNGQNRRGCMCLTCKTELLENKHRCPHGCLYCYWRD